MVQRAADYQHVSVFGPGRAAFSIQERQMVQSWRPQKIEAFVERVVEQAAPLDVFYAIVLQGAYGMQPIDLADEEDSHHMRVEMLRAEWEQLSAWERLNAFLKIRDVVGRLAKKTFEELNRIAREADRP